MLKKLWEFFFVHPLDTVLTRVRGGATISKMSVEIIEQSWEKINIQISARVKYTLHTLQKRNV